MVAEATGLKVPVKFGVSTSNSSRDMRLPHFVTNDDDTGVGRSLQKGKTPLGVHAKNR